MTVTASTRPLPAPPSGLPARREPGPVAGDLDERIRQVELRLIGREERFRSGLRRLTVRGRHALRPPQLLLSALGAAAAVAAVVWTVRSGRKPVMAVTPRAADGGTASRPRAEVPWVQWIGLAWPLLPARWRASVSPGTAAAVASVGLPLLQQLLRQPPKQALQTAPHVDLLRYAGTWHEIARLPAPFEAVCAGQPTATYTLDGGEVGVVNRCPLRGGGHSEARGVAHVVPGSGNAQLRVSLWPAWLRWLPLAWADYWVLHVDADYDVALVGHPNRRFLWLLSRSPTLSAERTAALVGMAAERGFDVHKLHFPKP